MSRCIFGWSYPPGCSGPPEDREPVILRCKHCKSFLGKPIRTEPWEASNMCEGIVGTTENDLYAKQTAFDECLCGDIRPHAPHKVVWDSGQYDIYFCERCKKETKL